MCLFCLQYMSRDIDFQQCGMCDQQRLRSACAYAQADQSLCLSLEYSMTLKLLTEHDLDCLSLKGDCTGSPGSTLVNMPHCWKSHVAADDTVDVTNTSAAVTCTRSCGKVYQSQVRCRLLCVSSSM